jgi:hypothetical protein
LKEWLYNATRKFIPRNVIPRNVISRNAVYKECHSKECFFQGMSFQGMLFPRNAVSKEFLFLLYIIKNRFVNKSSYLFPLHFDRFLIFSQKFSII